MPCRSALLLALVAAVPAAELAVRDLRLGLSTRPADFDFELTTPLVKREGSDAFDAAVSLEAGARWSFNRPGDTFGLIGGGELAIDAQSYDDGDGLGTMWARVAGGVGWALSDRLTLTAEGLAGYGLATAEFPETAAAPSFEADGTATSFETRLTATWQITRTFNAGLSAGWLIASYDLSGDDADLTIDQSGWYAGLVLGWRINDVPPPLE